MTDVYCDNKRLEENILDAKPSESGLYPHEIVMIFHAEISRFRTTVTEFGSSVRVGRIEPLGDRKKEPIWVSHNQSQSK